MTIITDLERLAEDNPLVNAWNDINQLAVDLARPINEFLGIDKVDDGGIHPKDKRPRGSDQTDHQMASRAVDRYVQRTDGPVSEEDMDRVYNQAREGIRMQRGSRGNDDDIPQRPIKRPKPNPPPKPVR